MLYVHRSERADPLAHALSQILREPSEDPFARELVAVPTRGMERWLTQRLSSVLGARSGASDGISAAIDFPFPSRLTEEAAATACGLDPKDDPWHPDRLVWTLMQVTQAAQDEQWLSPLSRHLRPPAGERRYPRLLNIARLYSRYASERPQLINAWLDGDDAGAGQAGWQPRLLREAAALIAAENPARRLGLACERLRENPDLVALPARLSVFGLTRLPPAQLQLLQALAAGRDVHLMALHPSPGRWDGAPARNRLLASWGRESSGLAQLLRSEVSVHHQFIAPAPTNLLSRLQADIRENLPAPGPPLPGQDDARLTLSPDDQSVRVHACHGRTRQVEVLREAILHRLQDDPTLEPRDILVMCPSVEVFAPLIEAAFQGGELHVRLADRSLRQTNAVLNVIAKLLEFPSGRLTASDVLDLADNEPVRRCLRLREDDLAQIREWVAGAQIHWGLDAGSRERFKLADVEAGTWAAGLRRLLLAVAIDERQGLFGDVIPSGSIGSGEIDLAGRLAELVSRLQSTVAALSGPQPLNGWLKALTEAADTLTLTSQTDAWQRDELDRLVEDLAAGEQSAGADSTALTLAEFRALLGRRLEGRPTRANFRTGHLTVCTLSPMRSVPHRVICLLGLDDGHFPRAGHHDGDDALLADPMPWDRDARSEDRQLLLDALLAAQDALIITYTGNDERTNTPRPPAVPVGELLDAIDQSAAGARELVVVHHPLQSFDPRNFRAGPQAITADGRPWSFDRVALDGAVAFSGERTPPPAFLPAPLPPAPQGTLALEDLIRFVERPVRAFLRQRLGLSLVRSDEELDDALPVELDGLGRWAVGQRLLEALIAGSDGRQACLAEIARGTLPPGKMGMAVIREVFPRAQAIAAAGAAFAGGGRPQSFQTNIFLEGDRRLTGTVSGVRGNVLLAVSYSRLNARHRIGAWVRLLALTAAHPEIPFEAVTVARARGGAQKAVEVARIPVLGGDQAARAAAARASLQALVELRDEGLREPLPLPPESTLAYATAALTPGGADPAAEALREWRDRYSRENERIEGEAAKDENPLVLGPELDLPRIAVLAPRLWKDLLDRERVERA